MESQQIIQKTMFLLDQSEIKAYAEALWIALDLMKDFHNNQTNIDNLEELAREFSNNINHKE